MKRRFEGGPGESAEGENPIPAQPTKLRGDIRTPSIDADKNKEKFSVKDSPTTHLTKVEATQDSQTQLQLEEKNTLPAFLKEDNNPTRLARPKLIIKPGTFSSMPSTCPICSEYGHFPDAGKNKETDSVKHSPTTHLTKVEAAQDSQTQFQLEEKDTVPTFPKEDNNPTCLADELIIKPGTFSSMPSSCAICSEPDHWYDMCPWRKRLPKGVTQVGKGYVVEWP